MHVVNEQIECWFVACLLAVGPEATLREAQEFMGSHIPNGSGSAWYAAWWMNWLEDEKLKRAGLEEHTVHGVTGVRNIR